MLINAPTTYAAATTADWDTTAEDIGAFPPIGLSYLAGYLAQHTDHDVSILDCLAERLDYVGIEQRIIATQPEFVGITAFTPTFYDVLMVARLVKKNLPDCYVCLGGSHVNTFLQESLSHPEIDFCVHGEGEIIFANLLNALTNGQSVTRIAGLSYKENGQIITTGEPGYMQDINTLPPPAFALLPLQRYKSAVGTGQIVGVIASSRGCPYACTYCNRPYRTYREYTIERILSEMAFHYQRGTREFLFFDDMFNIKPKRVIAISEAIMTDFPDIVWAFRGRVDQITEEMARQAKKSGCRQIMFGVEAATDADLKAIKKQITTKQVVDAIATCKQVGIETSTNWIIGLPTHKSAQDVLALLDFAIRSGSDYAQFNIMIPYVDAPIYADGVQKGILPPNFWSEYVRNPTPNAYIPIWDEYLSREELSQLLKICYRKFYLRPAKVVEQILRVRSFAQFKMKLHGALTVLGFGGFTRDKKIESRIGDSIT